MAILSVAEAKSLSPKIRGLSDIAVQLHLDATEERIVAAVGNPDETELVVRPWTGVPMREIRLPRPVKQANKSNISSIRIADADPVVDIESDTWLLVGDRVLRSKGYWPSGCLLEVTYTAVSIMSKAKIAQHQLLSMALISDGLVAIEDGEFIERRHEANTNDLIARSEKRIMAKLVGGYGLV